MRLFLLLCFGLMSGGLKKTTWAANKPVQRSHSLQSQYTLTQASLPQNLLNSINWDSCDNAFVQKNFPRKCFVLAIQAKKLGFRAFFQQMEDICIQAAQNWVDIDATDELILKMYFQRCYYRQQSIKNSSSFKSFNKLHISFEKQDLVRFLYLQDSYVHRKDANTKRLPDLKTNRPRSK